MSRQCPTCATPASDTARFCGDCGRALPAAPSRLDDSAPSSEDSVTVLAPSEDLPREPVTIESSSQRSPVPEEHRPSTSSARCVICGSDTLGVQKMCEQCSLMLATRTGVDG
jgi:hypothetical protein